MNPLCLECIKKRKKNLGLRKGEEPKKLTKSVFDYIPSISGQAARTTKYPELFLLHLGFLY
jgi:hypothetical protein